MFNYLVYASCATHLMTDDDLSKLLEQSRKSNEISGVTGMLLYRGGRFLQVLESEQNVETLYEKIKVDPRHRDARILLTGESTKRQFPNWSMGFVNLCNHTDQELQGFTDFLNTGFDVDAMRRQPQRAYRMLLMFREAE